MKKISTTMILAACVIGGLACVIGLFVAGLVSGAQLGILLASALVPVTGESASDSVRAGARRWHGGIKDKFSNFDNLVRVLKDHPEWELKPGMLADLEECREQLLEIMGKCNSSTGSPEDRQRRNTLLKKAVGYSLNNVKAWANYQYAEGVIPLDGLHNMHFLLPGEKGGYHSRSEGTKELPNTRVRVLNMVTIEVIIDQANVENVAKIRRSWPKGVMFALIVLLSLDGKTEIIRQMTTVVRTEIKLPEDSRGKMFIAKAAFLKHVDDSPTFGDKQVTFTMPQTTEDLATVLGRQRHYAMYDEHLREIERQDKEIERLKAELAARKRG
jgi:hypothetical protein